VSGQLHAPAALPPGKSPRYPFYRRLGGPQSRSGRYGEVKVKYWYYLKLKDFDFWVPYYRHIRTKQFCVKSSHTLATYVFNNLSNNVIINLFQLNDCMKHKSVGQIAYYRLVFINEARLLSHFEKILMYQNLGKSVLFGTFCWLFFTYCAAPIKLDVWHYFPLWRKFREVLIGDALERSLLTGIAVLLNCEMKSIHLVSVEGSPLSHLGFVGLPNVANSFSKSRTQLGARGSVVGWGTTLQGGRSPVRVPDEVDFFNLPNPSSRIMARNFPGGKKWPGRRADNLATIYEPNVWKCGSLNLSQP
jgi:hypothetical protein